MLKVQEIRELIKLIDQSTISEFKYETEEAKITLKKDYGNEVLVQPQPQPTVEAPVEQPKVTKSVEEKSTPELEKKETEQTQEKETKSSEEASDYDYEVVSPMVGTFYRKPSPESDPYVEVGSEVKDDTIVCIVEAMKLFNEIEAEATGEIVEILVEDGELVEYGQPLFRVKTK
ncbi:MAG TPA: acetyl-CoA carboxylase biotin carboxyl carrier protein [Bacillota bacterium]